MATFKYIVKRLVLALFVFVIIMTMCFFLVKMLPQIPAEQFGKDQATIELRREQLGYNKPLPEQYFIFWGQALKGNWGLSETLYPMSDVWETFVDKLPYSMALNLYSTLISIPIGIAFGIFAALKKNKWQDQVISTGVMVVISVPVFIYGMLIQYLLCYKLKWFNHTIDYTQGAFAASTFVGMIPA
ncbi:MAG: ABC transporter permease, partial [Clostridia bacterium]|nr:ABC transporter permease [Clostridia bacterium]